MRKITALILAAVMVVGMSTAALAATSTQGTTSQSATVNYSVSTSYTWTVPDTLTAGGTAGTVSATNVVINPNEKLQIAISGNTVSLSYNGDTVSSTITYTTLVVDAGATAGGNTTISVAAPTGCKYAGTYTGAITFTASLVPAGN